MQAVLISSKDKIKGRKEAEKIFRELRINNIDITILTHEKAIGIGDVREIQKKIYLRPIKSDVKAVLIDAANGITIEAQNALLKTLEESPESTIIVLQVQNADEVLPTILSRCKVYQLSFTKEKTDVSEHLKIITSDGVGTKLKIAQDLSKDSPRGEAGKTEALDFIENLIITSRENLIGGNYKMAGQIKSLQKYHTIIKTTNVNLRLALENLFLNI